SRLNSAPRRSVTPDWRACVAVISILRSVFSEWETGLDLSGLPYWSIVISWMSIINSWLRHCTMATSHSFFWLMRKSRRPAKEMVAVGFELFRGILISSTVNVRKAVVCLLKNGISADHNERRPVTRVAILL